MKRPDIVALTDEQLRRSIYISVCLALLLPPFIGGSLMGLMGFYPMPEFYLIFTSYALPYVSSVLLLVLSQVPRASRYVIGLTHMELARARDKAQRVFARLPWYLLAGVTLYSIFGALSADYSLEALGYREYTLREHLYNQFGLIPVVLITTFPIFFYSIDRLGRYLGPRGISVTAIPLWMKIAMLGIVTPMLIDSLLIGYYINRTGHFNLDVAFFWAALMGLAMGGTWMAWRSLRQGIAPLQAFIEDPVAANLNEARKRLVPYSLDELGVLTAHYADLLATQKSLSDNLLRAQSLTNAVIDNAGVLVLLLDREGRIVRFNHAAEKLSGYSFAEVEGKYPWDTVLPAEDADTIRKQAFEVLANNPQALSGKYTNYWVSKSGERHMIDWLNTVLMDAGGKMEFMVSVGIDITDSLRNEETLRTHSQILHAMAEGVSFTDARGILRFTNPAFDSMFGYLPGELVGQSVSVLNAAMPQDNQRLVNEILGTLSRNEMWEGELVNRHKDGSRFYTRARVNAIHRGGESWSVTVQEDVTARKLATDALHASEARLRQTQKIAETGSWELDLESDVLTWSDETWRIFGLKPGTADSSYGDFLERVHPEDRKMVDEAFDRAVEARATYDVAHRIVRPDGSIRWVQERGETIYADDGKALRTIGAVQDITRRKEAEKHINEQSRLMDLIFRHSLDSLVLLDKDYNFIRVSEAYAHACQRPAAEFPGHNHFELYPSDLQQELEEYRREKKVYNRSARPFRFPDHPEWGATYWDIGLVPILDRSGEIELFMFTLKDVTARVRAEEELVQHREHLEELVQERTEALKDALGLNEQILSVSLAGVAAYHYSGQCIFVNEAMARLVNATQQQLLAQNFRHIPSWKVSGLLEQALTTLESGESRTRDFHVVSSFGREVWFECSFARFHRGGEPHLLIMANDTSVRKLTEAELEKQSRRNEIIIRSTLDGFFSVDSTARITDCNDAFCHMLGYTRDELLQLSIPDIEMNERPEEIIAHMQRVVERGHDRFDSRHRCKDGSALEVELSVNLARIGDSQLFIAFVRDISARRLEQRQLIQAKEHAERASQAKSEFLSRMSHELRTPMNAILGFTQILEIEPLAVEQHNYVQEIHAAGEHLLELINDLLDLARIDTGRLATAIETVTIGKVVEQAIQMVQPLVQQKQLSLLNKCDPALAVLADPTRFRQILVNLLSNAAKYNRTEGSIRIDSQSKEDGYLCIRVSDTGPGIAPEKLDQLFKPFERLGAEASGIDGTGIGLAISKRLGELMGGSMGAESALGQGSTFWLNLPQADKGKPVAVISQKESRDIVLGKRKVLYVEDNAANLKVVESMLHRQPNLMLLSATNGEYGLELAARYRPDIILLDIHLPGMDGYAVLKALHAGDDTRHIPVVALSADAMPVDIEAGLKAGFVHYLTKPIKMGELVAVLERHMKPPEDK